MMRLAALLRRTNALSDVAIRGPKKKKGGGGQAVIESTDIVNIFKDRADPQITYIQHYPIFVQELSLGTHSFHQNLLGVMHDIDALKPYRANYNGFIKAFKRQRTKSLNLYRHVDAKPDLMREDDTATRRALFNVGGLTKQQQEQRQREYEEAEAAGYEDEDF